MFISEAFAQVSGTGPQGGLGDVFQQMLPLLLIFVVFYFLLFRPQQQKQKKHREMVSAMRRGDRVMTQSGIFGTINKVVSDTEVVVEIAENVKIRMLRSSIAEVLSKTEPVPAAKAEGEDDAKSEGSTEGAAAKEEAKPNASVLGRLFGKK